MKQYKKEMNPENTYFALSIAEFCKRHNLSGRKLSIRCGGSNIKFAPSLAALFLKGYGTDELAERIRPVIARTLVEFLQDRGFYPDEIERELSHIFDPKEFIKMIANRQTLSPEAIQFFGLKNDPFDVDILPDAEDLFTTKELDSIAVRIKDAIELKRFIAIIGGVGSGKTLLKLRIAHELADKKVKLIYPEFPEMCEISVANIITLILTELGQKIPRDKTLRLRKIREILTQMHEEDIKVGIILDESHRLHDSVISSTKNFWEMHNGAFSKLLSIVLFGQPAFVEARLRDVQFKEIRQRVQIVDMPDLKKEAVNYIAHRLAVQGGDINKLFSPDAIKVICQNATTPLAIGNLVNEALMDAFAMEEPKVETYLEFFKKLGKSNHVVGLRQRAA